MRSRRQLRGWFRDWQWLMPRFAIVHHLIWAALGIALVLVLQGMPKAQAADAINIARPTWDTGWFQAEVYRSLLERLGYQVNAPRTLSNEEFYEQATAGTVDLWASGWFPLHNRYLDQANGDLLEPVGFEVPGGALQGYLVDRATAERLNIRNLEDFLKPEVVDAFDQDGDGRADLVGCNRGWACAGVINHHLQEYGLGDTIKHLQGDYAPMMEDVVKAQRQGEAVFFYTWTPNWTVNELVPGEDVVWLEVPYPSLPPDQKSLESETVMTGIEGCVADPCTLGFPRNDIRAVANRDFLEANPAVRSLLEQVAIPLEDIAAQNALMLAGEDEESDIRRHAETWLDTNRELVEGWLATASATAEVPPQTTPSDETATPPPVPAPPREPLRLVTKRFEPFVIYEDQQYQGFSIDLWAAIAAQLDIPYDLVGVNSVAKLLDEVERGAADVAIAGIGITSQREERLDFSYPYYESGLQVMVPSQQGELGKLIAIVGAVLRSPRLYYGIGILTLVLLLVAHLLWFSERSHNKEFPDSYLQGVWEAFWWAAVTVTTVGYGDKVPKKFVGRLFGLVWMFSGYFVFAYFTASIATTFTVQELQGTINGLEDLPGKRIATVAQSAAAEFLDDQTNLLFQEYSTLGELQTAIADDGNIDAIIYDAPVLQYFVSHDGQGQYEVVGEVFQALSYGIALQQESPYREEINAALLNLYESGQYDEIYQEWFG